jgi:LPXTG-motif cell wall-anchored protein
MNEFLNPFYFLAGIVLLGLVFLVLFAGRRKQTKSGPVDVAPGSKDAPVSGTVTDPKKHKG